jgi:hypothetical protein
MLEDQITPEKEKSPVVTIVIGVIVVATIGISLWALFKTPANAPAPAVEINIPAAMGPEEQAYAQSLRIENVALSRAENFIHQQVTILNAEVINDGSRSLQTLMVTVEFSDDMRQVVLRETRGVLGNPPTLLGPGQKRDFQISFDRVPTSWNMQAPVIKVGYLKFASIK